MAAYRIIAKREFTLKIEQRKSYNNVGRIYPALLLFLSTLKCIYTLL